MSPPIRILVVDDSAVIRMVLGRVIGRTDGMKVVGVAANGFEALEAARLLDPDVITLDVEMPELDGLETLRRLLAERPTRVVMLSHATKAGAEVTLDALRAGAIDAIAKPDTAWGSGPNPFVDDLLAKIQAAALVPPARILAPSSAGLDGPATPPTVRPVGRPGRTGRGARGLVVVATSTGGPQALESLISRFPAQLGAGVVIVQHMLNGFTGALAHRLDKLGPLAVREATAGVQLIDDMILVAPGDRHIFVDGAGRVTLDQSPRINGVRPAADVTLLAAAPVWGPRLLVVVLTGMGRDGTAGAQAARANGGFVLAQDEASAVVYGMPRSVTEAGSADRIVPLNDVAAAIADWASTLGGDVPAGADRPPRWKTATVAES